MKKRISAVRKQREWGPEGAQRCSPLHDVALKVDNSFSVAANSTRPCPFMWHSLLRCYMFLILARSFRDNCFIESESFAENLRFSSLCCDRVIAVKHRSNMGQKKLFALCCVELVVHGRWFACVSCSLGGNAWHFCLFLHTHGAPSAILCSF